MILVELAGMQPDAFKIGLNNQMLTISGTRDQPEFEEAAFHQAEIGFGEFRIQVAIPWSVYPENVTATYSDGFLRLDLPRQQARRVHIVDVDNDNDEQTSIGEN